MMDNESLINLAAAVTLGALVIYAVLGGADFGGGVWDLFATGPRKDAQRDAIARAMGPVWEANHVWLIFVLVMLFTCFPRGYAALAVQLFLPFHLALVGIMLRGAAFVFRAYAKSTSASDSTRDTSRLWGAIFGAASLISPFLLGAAFGAVTAGTVHVAPVGAPAPSTLPAWLRPYSVASGLLALSTCAYLASVFLTIETRGQLQEDFRRRAIIAGTTTAALAAVVLLLAYEEANWFFRQLVSARSMPIVGAGLLMFTASAFAVFTRRYSLARWCAVGEISLLLVGWGNAQRPYLAHPDFTLIDAAGSPQTIRFLLATLPLGAALIIPSLWILFRVFSRSAAASE